MKIYRDLSTAANQPPSSPTSAELNRTNWAVSRVGVDTNGDFYGTASGQVGVRTDNIEFSLTGKNVDVIIQDSGIQASHPEFLDGNGKSRVLDIVLDGPYYIDKPYFDSNSLTFTRPDGRVGIATTAAEEWWENGAKRSGAYSSIGTIAIPAGYTEAKAMGIGIGTVNSLISGHGTACASLAAGKNFGLAFEDYAHFTSPIRRYPDLLVHRAIKRALEKKHRECSNKMVELGAHLSMTERRADDASRDVEQWLKCEYMRDKVGESFNGVISGVAGFGLFVELTEVFVEGLISVRDLKEDYFNFDDIHHQLKGQRGGRIYRLGDLISVKVASVNLDDRKIEFVPA